MPESVRFMVRAAATLMVLLGCGAAYAHGIARVEPLALLLIKT